MPLSSYLSCGILATETVSIAQYLLTEPLLRDCVTNVRVELRTILQSASFRIQFEVVGVADSTFLCNSIRRRADVTRPFFRNRIMVENHGAKEAEHFFTIRTKVAKLKRVARQRAA